MIHLHAIVSFKNRRAEDRSLDLQISKHCRLSELTKRE